MSKAAPTTAATTATTGRLIAPMAVTMAVPTVEKMIPSKPAAAIMPLIPAITGHAIRPIPPSTPTSASAPAVTVKIVCVSSGFAFAQAATLPSISVAETVRRRSAEFSLSNTSICKSS
ncbi:hypothetical protein D3C78_867740 [compost metagenome]